MSACGLEKFELLDIGSRLPGDALAEFLERTELLRDLSWEQLKRIGAYLEARALPANTHVFREGDAGEYWCVILEGNIDVIKEVSPGHSCVIASLRPGATLGEMAIIDGERRSANACTTQPTHILALKSDRFNQLLKDYPGLGTEILKQIARLLSRRLRRTSGQLADYLEMKKFE